VNCGFPLPGSINSPRANMPASSTTVSKPSHGRRPGSTHPFSARLSTMCWNARCGRCVNRAALPKSLRKSWRALQKSMWTPTQKPICRIWRRGENASPICTGEILTRSWPLSATWAGNCTRRSFSPATRSCLSRRAARCRRCGSNRRMAKA